MADLFLDGFSACMNRRITQLFIRLHWMEEAGSNFAGIFSGTQPISRSLNKVFDIIVYERRTLTQIF